jgi:hypothetical protein
LLGVVAHGRAGSHGEGGEVGDDADDEHEPAENCLHFPMVSDQPVWSTAGPCGMLRTCRIT